MRSTNSSKTLNLCTRSSCSCRLRSCALVRLASEAARVFGPGWSSGLPCCLTAKAQLHSETMVHGLRCVESCKGCGSQTEVYKPSASCHLQTGQGQHSAPPDPRAGTQAWLQ